MEGGVIKPQRELKLLGEGSYGCVFHPGINCKGKIDTPNFVTKLQKSEKTSRNEWAVSQAIMKIRGYKKHFAPILKQCRVRISEEAQAEVDKCEVLPKTQDVYVSNKMRYVGNMTLGDYLQRLASKDPHALPKIWKTHAYLLKGLTLLATHGIVHHDLKSNNVMYDEKTETPIFIDFGMSILLDSLVPQNAKKFKETFFTFDTYDYWCIDVALCNYAFSVLGVQDAKRTRVTEAGLLLVLKVFLYGKKQVQEDASDMALKHATFTLPLPTDDSVATFQEKYFRYFGRFVRGNNTWWQVYEHVIQYANTWDNYSLAVICKTALQEVSANQPEVEQNSRYDSYVQTLNSVLFAMPSERPTSAQTRALLPEV